MIANIENAFKFVFKDKNWIIKVLIGAALSIIPIVNFIVFGYVLKILKDAKEGKEGLLPEWGDWNALFKDGVTVFIISLVYGAIIFGLWFINTIISFIPIVGCLSIIILPVLLISFILLAPAVNISLCRYLSSGSLKDALQLKEVFNEFKSKLNDYMVVTLINAGISLIASMAFCIAPFAYFWLWLVVARMFGEIYGTRPTTISV